MAVGDAVTVCDGEGTEYICRLTKIRDELCECEILHAGKSTAEPKAKITLFMAYPKGDKLETVIQKAVELGACEIIPFISSRCIKLPKADKKEARLSRLGRIAEEAAKQCGRAILPKVSDEISFDELIRRAAGFDLPIFCYEGEGVKSLKEILEGENIPETVCVVVGSEGGFSPEEAERAKEAGFRMANLGPRILRCETAPSYVLSALSYKFEL